MKSSYLISRIMPASRGFATLIGFSYITQATIAQSPLAQDRFERRFFELERSLNRATAADQKSRLRPTEEVTYSWGQSWLGRAVYIATPGTSAYSFTVANIQGPRLESNPPGMGDGLHSYTISGSGNLRSDSNELEFVKGKLHVDYQVSKDSDAVIFVPSLDYSSAKSGTRYGALSGQFTTDRLIDGLTISASATIEEFREASGSVSGGVLALGIEKPINKWLTLYSDYQFPSQVEGTFAWDLGARVKLNPRTAFVVEVSPDSTWIFAIGSRF